MQQSCSSFSGKLRKRHSRAQFASRVQKARCAVQGSKGTMCRSMHLQRGSRAAELRSRFKRHEVPFKAAELRFNVLRTFNAAELRSRLPLSLFRAPRMRDSTASVDDLRFKRHEVPFNAPAVRFKCRAMQSDGVAVKATSRSSKQRSCVQCPSDVQCTCGAVQIVELCSITKGAMLCTLGSSVP